MVIDNQKEPQKIQMTQMVPKRTPKDPNEILLPQWAQKTQMGNNYPNVHQLPKRTPKDPNGILLPK